MTLDQLFQIANATAAVGWLALLASPLVPRWADRIGGFAIPLVLALGYATMIALSFGGNGSDGGFDTLEGVAALFSAREAVLIGWLHFLAFDLFIGGWEVRTARSERIPFLLVVPCLAFTFLLGPIGLVLFLVLRGAWMRRNATRTVA